MNKKIYYLKNEPKKSRCIGQCIAPGKTIIHPTTFKIATNNTHTGKCPVAPVIENNKKIIWGECSNYNENDTQIRLDNYAVPNIIFDETLFLKMNYNILNYSDVINYLSTNIKDPILTKNRIIICAWKAFGETIKIIDDILLDFYVELISKIWIKDILDEINQYINITNETISLVRPDNNTSNLKEDIIIRNNYIIEQFGNKNIIYKFLVKMIKYNKEEDYNNIDIKKNYIQYIKNKILLSI